MHQNVIADEYLMRYGLFDYNITFSTPFLLNLYQLHAPSIVGFS
jgi:hypothetical protein